MRPPSPGCFRWILLAAGVDCVSGTLDRLGGRLGGARGMPARTLVAGTKAFPAP